MNKIRGGCLCGAVRYSSTAEPLATVICHCRNCQRQSGTAFSVVVGVPKGALQMNGAEPATFEDRGESGMPVRRRFCSNCGSPIFSEAAAVPAVAWGAGGTLDDTSWLQPQSHIWCESAQAWVRMDEALPRLPGNPPLS